MSSTAKVGLVALLAAATLLYALILLGYLGKKEAGEAYYVVFDNVGGLDKDSGVRLSGIAVGQVTSTEIMPNQKAKVSILITRPATKIPKNSVLTVSISFMGEKVLEITPKDGEFAPTGYVFVGTSPLSMYDIFAEGDKALKEIQKLAASTNTILADITFQEDFKASIHNLRAITSHLSKTTAQLEEKLQYLTQETGGLITDARKQVNSVGTNLQSFSSRLDNIAGQNQEGIKEIVSNLKETSLSLKRTLKTIEELVTKKEVSEDVLATLNNIRSISAEVEGIAKDIHTITSDETLKEDLKQTVQNAKEASEGAKQVVDRLKHFLGVKKDRSFDGGLLELDADVEWKKENGENSPNLNLRILRGCPVSAKIGIDSLGYDNLFNFQLSKDDANLAPHFGIVRGKLGAGVQQKLGRKANLTLDLYDTRDAQVDVIGQWELLGGFYLSGGVRDAFDRRNTVFGVGRRF